jgi:hypothetical protein
MPDRAGKVIDGAVGVLMLKIPEGPGLGRIQILRVIRYFICPHQSVAGQVAKIRDYLKRRERRVSHNYRTVNRTAY